MFTIIALPYTPEALEPVISAQTLSFHHGKHLQAYVDNLNKLIAGTDLEGKSLKDIILDTIPFLAYGSDYLAIFNNAGQILNHNLYFTQFAPVGASVIPSVAKESPLFAQIEKQWGSLAAFKTDFVSAGVTLFGSGWVWLQANPKGKLSIGKYSNADNPVVRGLLPILTFDVWEHAYYLDYQNRRAAHLEALWGIVDWKAVEERYNR